MFSFFKYTPILKYGAEERVWTKEDVSGLRAAEMRFVIIEGEPITGITRRKIKENVKIQTLEGRQ
jgi:hypothetical protein